mmetsp:Transcript_88501/g.275175  ORF Transcript_88501/g.275175 Transcript_88501/m.275175 type:complete len:337 (+) Transcript_88501:466-1476(+)
MAKATAVGTVALGTGNIRLILVRPRGGASCGLGDNILCSQSTLDKRKDRGHPAERLPDLQHAQQLRVAQLPESRRAPFVARVLGRTQAAVDLPERGPDARKEVALDASTEPRLGRRSRRRAHSFCRGCIAPRVLHGLAKLVDGVQALRHWNSPPANSRRWWPTGSNGIPRPEALHKVRGGGPDGRAWAAEEPGDMVVHDRVTQEATFGWLLVDGFAARAAELGAVSCHFEAATKLIEERLALADAGRDHADEEAPAVSTAGDKLHGHTAAGCWVLAGRVRLPRGKAPHPRKRGSGQQHQTVLRVRGDRETALAHGVLARLDGGSLRDTNCTLQPLL